MTKIIGHRGAAGIALENTIPSFEAAIKIGVDAIEFDVQVTKDGQYVVCHDDFLDRVSDSHQTISTLTFKQLQKIQLLNGERVPLLRTVLQTAGKTPVIVEIKVRGHCEGICRVLDEFPALDISIASFLHDVARECKALRPNLQVLLAEGQHPIEVIQKARAMHADGLDLNYKLLNPLTYWLANRAGLQIMAYTVNSPIMVRLIRQLYPRVWICTNYPDRFIRRTAATTSSTSTTPRQSPRRDTARARKHLP